MTTQESKDRPRPAFTKERFYVDHIGQHGVPALQRHVNRYKWAASHLENGWRVLDIGCGSGYGDPILLNVCDSVTGIDVNEEAIEYARWKAQSVSLDSRLNYGVCALDAISPNTVGQRYDAAVCIEVIEHVSLVTQHAFMAHLKTVLAAPGRLLITTPVKGSEPMTEFHVSEFTPEHFRSFLLEYFYEVGFDDPKAFGIPENFILANCHGVRP